MPIVTADEFSACFLISEAVAATVSRAKSHGFTQDQTSLEATRAMIFCSNDCDALLAFRVLQMHPLFQESSKIDYDIFFICSVEDIYEFLEKQTMTAKENAGVQLLAYQRVLLLGFGGHSFTDPRLYAELQEHFLALLNSSEEKELLQFWVFDFRRPAFPLFYSETQQWFLIVDEDDIWNLNGKISSNNEEIVEDASGDEASPISHSNFPKISNADFSEGNSTHGLYFSTPLCFLMNKIVCDVGVNNAVFAKKDFLTAMSLFWHYFHQYIDTDKYEGMLSTLQRDVTRHQRYPGDEVIINTRYGMLPFLQYSCLKDALNASEQLFAQSQDTPGNVRDNELRMNCSVTRKEMVSHQAEFRITKKEKEVRNHLRSKYKEDVLTLDWARPEHPNLNNAALAYMAVFLLSFSLDEKDPKSSYIGNCRDFLEIIETLINVDHCHDLQAESFLLQALMPASQAHLRNLFEKVRTGRIEKRSCGGAIVWLFNFNSHESIFMHPAQLRILALLVSSYKAKGSKPERSSVILSFSRSSDAEETILYAVNPLADEKTPDLWPVLLRHLSYKRIVKQNAFYPNMASLSPLALQDVTRQLQQLYRQRHNLNSIIQEHVGPRKRKERLDERYVDDSNSVDNSWAKKVKRAYNNDLNADSEESSILDENEIQFSYSHGKNQHGETQHDFSDDEIP